MGFGFASARLRAGGGGCGAGESGLRPAQVQIAELVGLRHVIGEEVRVEDDRHLVGGEDVVRVDHGAVATVVKEDHLGGLPGAVTTGPSDRVLVGGPSGFS